MVQCVTYFGLILKVGVSIVMSGCGLILLIDIDGWGISPRGAGYLFGNDVVSEVCYYYYHYYYYYYYHYYHYYHYYYYHYYYYYLIIIIIIIIIIV